MDIMPNTGPKFGAVLERIRRTALARGPGPASDRDLLERFITLQDETAFAGLVQRYGPMVMGVCRRLLRHRQDAEDAFQAVFLVLARKAAAIRRSESLPAWLHSVAYRAAVRLRAAKARRLARQAPLLEDPHAAAGEELTVRETQRILEEELNRLADKYRAPLLLCCLQGRTRDEAAQQLGWSVGVLRGRLDRGRELLRARLTRRGIALAGALLPLGVAGTSEAAVLPALVSSTVRAALAAAHGPAAAGAVSAQGAALVQGVIQAMFLAKMKVVAAGLCVLTIVGASAGLVTYEAQAQGGGGASAAQKPPAKSESETAQLKREIERLRLELEQARLLLKLANREILDLRAARDEATARALAERDQAEYARRLAEAQAAHARRSAEDQDLRARQAAAKALAEAVKAKGFVGVFSPDAKTIAVVDKDSFSLIDAGTGKELRRFLGHGDVVTALAFTPDGKTLASGSKDKSAGLWDIASGKLIAKIGLEQPANALAFSPDGRTLVIRQSDQTSEFDVPTGKLVRVTKQQVK
jgi:RNA polymerase sigma factor (sigma-70 family)